MLVGPLIPMEVTEHAVQVPNGEATTAGRAALQGVVGDAFGDAQRPEIADLVEAVLGDPGARPYFTLVACTGRAVGNILVNGARVEPAEPLSAALLAPLGVHPDSRASRPLTPCPAGRRAPGWSRPSNLGASDESGAEWLAPMRSMIRDTDGSERGSDRRAQRAASASSATSGQPLDETGAAAPFR